jgi:hypothetical protein
MQRKLVILALIGLLVMNAGPLLAEDGFYVVVAAGRQVGTKITSLPYTINTPGAYYLASNLSSSNDGITITASNVTLDLMGFTITTGVFKGISLFNVANVEIRNGTVNGGYGIICGPEYNNSKNHRIINLRIVSVNRGISLLGPGHLIQGCKVEVRGCLPAIETNDTATVSGCTIRFLGTCGLVGGWYGITIKNGLVRGNVVTGSL